MGQHDRSLLNARAAAEHHDRTVLALRSQMERALDLLDQARGLITEANRILGKEPGSS